ncbi:MAG: heterodisulfide reductase-related iron-sulfur binding cluster [Hyphomicrobiaceae bacterium]
MAVSDDRVTFWFGCNMLRHAEMIRLSILLLEKVGFDVNAAGGPAYCCGTSYDHQPHAASAMSARTVSRFNDAATSEGRGTVVTWCPSCHMHMADIMAPGNPTSFDVTHITELLASRADRLAPLLTHKVERRVLLHRHLGFETHVAVNEAVCSVLAAIPGLEIVDGPAVPGHMCSGLEAVPGAAAKAARETWDAASAHGCDTLATIFHSCHRIMAPIDGRQDVVLRNWVHLVAEAMGLPAGDAYRDWRKGSAPDEAAIERVGEKLYAQLVEPELRKAPVVQ